MLFLFNVKILTFPVPGGPANKTALPAIRFIFTKSTIMPAAVRASTWPTKPLPICFALPSVSRPSPLTWLCAATR
ncbi:Proline--tRNA ligase [Trichinella pseudospiralis]